MGYQALLFCPDEKTARTVTQVLSELEFSVESCAEPFAAVKKLMGEHFDAIVVDCDNEQNATLLFKSARNSTSNQTSLAVAVVEGQAGVAKAFRIGANLVLTKPINVEQAKGTLRVARGLLRKGEPGKPVAAPSAPVAAAAPAASPAKPVAAKPVPPLRSAPPVAVAPRPAAKVTPEVPKPVSIPDPVAAPPLTAAASTASAHADEDLFEISSEAPSAAPVAIPTPVPAPVSNVPELTPEPKPPVRPMAPAAASASSGAATAPAREIAPAPAIVNQPAAAASSELSEKPAEPAAVSSTVAAPTFSFGGANLSEEPSGSKTKIFIGIAAAVVVAVGSYFTWSYFQGKTTSTSSVPATAISQPAQPSKPAPAPASSAAPAPASTVPSSSAQPAAHTAQPTAVEESQPVADKDDEAESIKGSKGSAKTNSAPLMVKSGSVHSSHVAAPAPDAPAPSVIGMAMPGSSAPPLNLGSGAGVAPRPMLQTLNISQGVSRGLLMKKVSPTYPSNAMSMHVEGAVELLATVSKAGNITAVKVLSGEPLLTRAAVDAVKQWKYKPYLLNGEPVEIQTQITVNFKLPH